MSGNCAHSQIADIEHYSPSRKFPCPPTHNSLRSHCPRSAQLPRTRSCLQAKNIAFLAIYRSIVPGQSLPASEQCRNRIAHLICSLAYEDAAAIRFNQRKKHRSSVAVIKPILTVKSLDATISCRPNLYGVGLLKSLYISIQALFNSSSLIPFTTVKNSGWPS